MKKIIALGLATLLFSPFNVYGVNPPQPQASDAHIALVNYADNNVVPINGQTFVTTQIAFGKEEVIQNVQNGDTSAWQASINKVLPYMLFIKPTAFDSHTNMIVVTNRHTYYFTLQSNQEGQHTKRMTYAIKFQYPKQHLQQQLIALHYVNHAKLSLLNTTQQPNHYHWQYSFWGDKSIVPMHVFDDGHFTYLQLQPHQSVPAVFMVDNPEGREAVVNYRQVGHYLVIERLVPQLTLRVGKSHVAVIFNDRLIAKRENKPLPNMAPPAAPPLAVTMSAVPNAKPLAQHANPLPSKPVHAPTAAQPHTSVAPSSSKPLTTQMPPAFAPDNHPKISMMGD